MQIQELYKIFLASTGVCTDTRTIKTGNIFFALKGDHFNGNTYALKALEAGAGFAVVDEDIEPGNPELILVTDVLKCLQDLAGYHRSQFDIPFIGITGSNGKTTTKELVHAVLSTKYKTYTTEGNLNNHIGIPLTLLKVKKDAEIAIVEMGANHQKEIAGYCVYTQPTHGLITNCGKAHLEGFGSLEGVRKGKGELFDFIREKSGVVFINNDYEYLQRMSKGIQKIISYGSENADFTGSSKDSGDGFLQVSVTRGADLPLIKTHLVGDYNLPNVLVAVAIGKTFAVPEAQILEALENYIPTNSRSQMIEKRGAKIILDAYNANPSSMRAAIMNFGKMAGDKKYILLGGMKEMGSESQSEHKGIIDLLEEYRWEKAVLVGEEFRDVPQDYLHFANAEEARAWFTDQDIKDALVLIKGSRGIRMEKLLEGF